MGKCSKINEQTKVFVMRTQEELERIKQNIKPSGQIEDFITSDERNNLLLYYNRKASNIVRKPTGPKTYNLENYNDLDWLLDRLKASFGEFKPWSIQFFDTAVPHMIHNDDHPDNPNSYKTFLFPLSYNPWYPTTELEFFVFEQFYFQGEAKFIKNDPGKFPIYKNKMLTEYTDVENLATDPIDNDTANKLTHLKKSWLEGLSVDKIFKWRFNSVIHFHPCQLHAAGNFLKHNVNRKIGLSIFTER